MLRIAVPNLRPSLTILLDITVKEAMNRKIAKQMFSKFDNMGARFFDRKRRAYKALSDHQDWRIVDAQQPIKHVHEEIVGLIDA